MHICRKRKWMFNVYCGVYCPWVIFMFIVYFGSVELFLMKVCPSFVFFSELLKSHQLKKMSKTISLNIHACYVYIDFEPCLASTKSLMYDATDWVSNACDLPCIDSVHCF